MNLQGRDGALLENNGRVLVRLFIQFLHARVGTILREPHVRNRSAGLSDYLSPVGARGRVGRSLFWVAPSPESDHGEVGTGCAVGSMCGCAVSLVLLLPERGPQTVVLV